MTSSKLFLDYDQCNHADSKLILFLNNLVKSDLIAEDNRVLNQQVAIEAIVTVRLSRDGRSRRDCRIGSPVAGFGRVEIRF